MEATVVARFLQLLSAMALCGASLFFIYGYRPVAARWPFRLALAAALGGFAATAAWLGLQAASLSDTGTSLAPLPDLALGTVFGRAALLRLVCFALAAALAMRSGPWWLLSALGVVAAGSFAWTGHGASNDGFAGGVHQVADVAHLLAASIWIGALVALVVLVRRGRAGPAERDAARLGLQRFSGLGLGMVAALVLSGLVNAWFLVGPAQLATLTATLYGRVLLLKLAVFVAMLGLAGLNRWVLTPRLVGRPKEPGLAPLSASIAAETALAIVVLALVAWLGVLEPPTGG